MDLPAGDGRAPLWELCPELGPATEEFSRAVQECPALPVRVAEAARMRVAELNDCVVCRETRVEDLDLHELDEDFYAGVGDPARRGRYSEREVLAIEFAERFVAGAAAFDDPFRERLRVGFSSREVVALTISVAKWLALGRVNAVLGLATSCPVRLTPPSPSWDRSGIPEYGGQDIPSRPGS